MKRPDIDQYFLKIASVVAERSTCRRHHVGAVAVTGKHILATGYNGAIAGQPDCLELGCKREGLPSGVQTEKCRAVHAEMNVLIQCSLHGVNVGGSTIYCTHPPCIPCAKVLANARIARFICFLDYQDKSDGELRGSAILNDAGIYFAVMTQPATKIVILE